MQMIQYCQEHNEILTSICVANHICNIKLCASCHYHNHQKNLQDEILPFGLFKTQYTIKLQNLLNEMNKITYNNEKTQIKQMIDDVERQFKTLTQNFRDQFQSIFQSLDAQYQQFFEINQKIQILSIAEFSKEELQKIIFLSKKESFDKLIKERQKIIENTFNLKENFKNFYVKFEQEIKSEFFNQPNLNKQKKIIIQEIPQNNNESNNDNEKQQIFQILQQVMNLLSQLQVIKYHFQDDPKNTIVHFTLIKLISVFQQANKLQISHQQSASLNEQLKLEIEKSKLEAFQIFQKFISNQISPGISKEYKNFIDFYIQTLQIANLPQLQILDLIFEQNDLFYPMKKDFSKFEKCELMLQIAKIVGNNTSKQIELNYFTKNDKDKAKFKFQQQNRNQGKNQPYISSLSQIRILMEYNIQKIFLMGLSQIIDKFLFIFWKLENKRI